jgi:phosphoribosylformylglycinamidine cyclo-ligase
VKNETSEPVSSAHGGEHAYRLAGVDYAALDANKRLALNSALATSGLLSDRGGRALDASRGEPAFVFEAAGQTLALVLEGLGTKSIVARAVAERGGDPAAGGAGFHAVAYDTVAAIVNDLCCVGARPLVVNAYFSSGRPDWFSHGEWYEQLVAGWQQGCLDSGATWGGGESPSLPGLVQAEHVELAGSAIGIVPPGTEPVLGQRLAHGDEIVLVASSGLHANGASLARRVADELPDGYGTVLAEGQTLGEALLRPSHIYSRLVESLIDAQVPVTYLSHITGHGLLKLMRPARELTYRIRQLPEVPEVLAFLAERSGMGARAAYSTFNMGCGFAVYCAAGGGASVLDIAAAAGLDAILAGRVEDGPRRVILEPLGVEFVDEELQLAPDR